MLSFFTLPSTYKTYLLTLKLGGAGAQLKWHDGKHEAPFPGALKLKSVISESWTPSMNVATSVFAGTPSPTKQIVARVLAGVN